MITALVKELREKTGAGIGLQEKGSDRGGWRHRKVYRSCA